MHSLYDLGLPFGQPELNEQRGQGSHIFDKSKPRIERSFNYYYPDFANSREAVRTAYKDLITNWWWEDPFYYPADYLNSLKH